MRDRLYPHAPHLIRYPAPDTSFSTATCVVIAWICAFVTGGVAGWLLHGWLS